MTHDHDDDDSLHAGCTGCIKAAEEEAWRVAPLREVTFCDRETLYQWTETMTVPAGATANDIGRRYGWHPIYAIEIGPVVSEADTGCEQGALL